MAHHEQTGAQAPIVLKPNRMVVNAPHKGLRLPRHVSKPQLFEASDKFTSVAPTTDGKMRKPLGNEHMTRPPTAETLADSNRN